MSVQTWTYALIGYFVMIGVFVSILSYGGVLGENSITTNDGVYNYEGNTTVIPPDTTYADTWNIGIWLGDLFGFFVFGINLDVGVWIWLIRTIFVYMPLTALILSIWYSMPTVSGG